MKRVKQVFKNLLTNWNYFIVGFEILGIACCMLYDRNFFFWPPQWAPIFNDIRLDSIGVITGVWIMAYALIGKHSNQLISIPLAIASAFIIALMFGEFVHIWFMGIFRLKLALWLEICLLIEILHLALIHNPKEKDKDA